MKKILYILCLLPFFSLTQGIDLELNQVLLIELNSETIVVPEGTIWKVTSAVSTVEDIESQGETFFYVNNSKSEIHQVSRWYNSNVNPNIYNTINFSSTFSSNSSFPLWLPEGTELKIGQNVSHLSILEFNTN